MSLFSFTGGETGLREVKSLAQGCTAGKCVLHCRALAVGLPRPCGPWAWPAVLRGGARKVGPFPQPTLGSGGGPSRLPGRVGKTGRGWKERPPAGDAGSWGVGDLRLRGGPRPWVPACGDTAEAPRFSSCLVPVLWGDAHRLSPQWPGLPPQLSVPPAPPPGGEESAAGEAGEEASLRPGHQGGLDLAVREISFKS